MANSKYFRVVAGRPLADKEFDEALIPSTDEKAALAGTDGSPSGSNKYVTNSDARNTNARTPISHDNTYHSASYITVSGVTYEALSGNGDVGQVASTVAAGDDSRFPTSDEKAALAGEGTPSGSNKFTTKSYVDGLVQGLDYQESILHTVDYRKTTSGAPTGTPTAGEKCLNTADAVLYQESGLAWDAGAAVTTGQRFVHKDDGSDTSGNSGTYTKDNTIYEYNGSTFDTVAANEGMCWWAEDENVKYVYNGSAYVKFESTTDHNTISGKQGGTTDEYYHITANQEAGLDAATAITGANPPQTLSDRDKLPTRTVFSYAGGLAAGQTDVEFYEANGQYQRVLQPSAGSLVKATLQSTSASTAGTLTAEPTINGTKAVDGTLDLVLDGTTTNDDKGEVAPGTITFSAGDKIGVKVTTDGSWANGSGDLEYALFSVYDT